MSAAVWPRRSACLACAAYALAGAAQERADEAADAQAQAPSDPPPIVEVPDIVYATVEEQALRLDLYLPRGVEHPPLLVWVHGGGWRAGSREPVPTMAFVESGYAMASVDYRLSTVAPFPAQVHDIKAAIRYLRANARELGYDATRIGILGVSAGGHLAALAGVSSGDERLEGRVGGDFDRSSDVQAIVSYFGASNLTTILAQSTPFGLRIREPALELLLGALPEERPELARLASPVFHVDPSDPPLLLLHGDQDPQMPINQSHELNAAYERNGLRVRFSVVSGAGHGGEQFFDAARTAEVAAFLDKFVRGTY